MNEGDECKRLSHEFELAKLKSHILRLEDIEQVKTAAVHLVDLLDGAKTMIKDLLEEDVARRKLK
tara:strand:+ start:132 stop:326 length:195 start_codon:yes stop_codon:yes gene_type:complete